MSLSRAPTQSGSSLTYPSHRTQHGHVMPQGTGPPTPVAPEKRPGAEMDDVQFISSKPVKRQKVDHHTSSPVVTTTPVRTTQIQPQPNSQPVLHPQPVLQMDCSSSLITTISTAPIADNGMSWPNSEVNSSHDRRITTGMVGLPSGLADWESIFGYRGCSLPELESYSMSAAARLKPLILGSPAISPKQIPKAITSTDSLPEAAPSEKNDRRNPTSRPGPNSSTTAVMSTPVSHEAPKPSAADPSIVQREETIPVAFEGCAETLVESTPPIAQQSPHKSKPDQIHQQQIPSEQSTTALNKTTQPHASKQPCKACMQMQQRAAFARAQGLPFANPNMSLHMISSGAYHPSVGPQGHPQFMPALQTGMHGFGPGFSPMMMPINTQNYSGAAISSPVLAHQHGVQPLPPRPTIAAHQQQPTDETPETGRKNAADPGGNLVVQPTDTSAVPTSTTAGPESPAKRPRPPLPLTPQHSSLIQPNYRKPSPNLIVDVAEMCQEKFPFEEVAKRHDTTVEKVADVFAAIIQVPLLRCPKDRRRAGRLAHERVKEYNRTKRELQEAAEVAKGQVGSSNSNSTYGVVQSQIVVRPLDVANALGPTE
ncbi:hypothetical protein PG993_003411 [Apiospora rasikravindrae]|uniref:Uncharacterized protein n=1 Tax=Apiospora rasikravindrae TaxID=990691 RepID=A0ABR1U1M3_9PEZI